MSGLLSLAYRLVRCLLGSFAVLVRSDLSKDVELLVLRQENRVLRRQLSGRVRRDHAGRLWFTALSGLVNRDLRPPDHYDASPAPATGLASARIRQRNVLGGLIHEYQQTALPSAKLQARGYDEILEPYRHYPPRARTVAFTR